MEDNDKVQCVPKNRTLVGCNIKEFDMYQPTLEEISSQPSMTTITRQDLNLSDQSKGFLIHNFMTKEECQFYINESNKHGYKSIENEFPSEYRNNTRFFGKNTLLSDQLWKRIQPFIKEDDLEGIRPYGFDQDGIWIPLGFNECYSFSRYESGGIFKPHYDSTYVESQDKRSIYTVQIYLNDDYQGGKTDFYESSNPLTTNEHKLTESVQPKTGMALIFNHDTLHEGTEVTQGVKYIVRVVMMFLRIDKTPSSLSEQQKLEIDLAQKLFIQSDNAEKDDKDTKLGVQLYVEAQMLLFKYRSISPSISSTSSSTSIQSLPDLIIFQIFETLSLLDILNTIQTCKQLSITLRKNQFWKNNYIKRYSLEAFKMEETSTSDDKPSVTGINFWENYENYEKGSYYFRPSRGGKKIVKKGLVTRIVNKISSISIKNKNSGVKLYQKNWYNTFKSIYTFHRRDNYLILDFGSEYIKFQNPSMPREIEYIPNRAKVSTYYHPHYVTPNSGRDTYTIGWSVSSDLDFQSCTYQGLLNIDYDDAILFSEFMKYIIRNYLNYLDTYIPLVIPVSPRYYSRELQDKPLFDDINGCISHSTHVYFANSGLLSLQANGMTSGTVVMLGYGSTLIVPFFKGDQLPEISDYPITGESLRDYVQEKMDTIKLKFEYNVAWHNNLLVSDNYEKDVTPFNDITQVINKSPEVYFNSSLLLKNENGGRNLIQEINHVIEYYNPQITNTKKIEGLGGSAIRGKFTPEEFSLLKNVIITGGISDIPNFVERFKRDLKSFDPSLTVYHTDQRINDVVKGASINLSLTQSLHDKYQQQK